MALVIIFSVNTSSIKFHAMKFYYIGSQITVKDEEKNKKSSKIIKWKIICDYRLKMINKYEQRQKQQTHCCFSRLSVEIIKSQHLATH